MQKATEGLTGNKGVNWFILPRKVRLKFQLVLLNRIVLESESFLRSITLIMHYISGFGISA
jgi:hypothetical protein